MTATAAVNTDDWPTLEEAATTLETSVRTMWRHIERGDVEVRKRALPGRKPANIVNPRDVDKLRPQPFVMPAAPPEEMQTAVVPVLPSSLERGVIDGIAAALKSLSGVVSIPPASNLTVPIDRKLWLTLAEAVAYTGFGSSVLRRGITDGTLEAQRGGPNGATIVRRSSLEAFDGGRR